MNFARLADRITYALGTLAATGLALLSVVIWVATGPAMGFSDTWQLWMNTFTTIVTFLMVFVLQATANRGDAAIQTKLDELIRAVPQADDTKRGIEASE